MTNKQWYISIEVQDTQAYGDKMRYFNIEVDNAVAGLEAMDALAVQYQKREHMSRRYNVVNAHLWDDDTYEMSKELIFVKEAN